MVFLANSSAAAQPIHENADQARQLAVHGTALSSKNHEAKQ
jgi:hypothetical protein